MNGEKISIKAATICIHGDGANAITFVKQINHSLSVAGIQIQTI
jgi:UPF0271 protein